MMKLYKQKIPPKYQNQLNKDKNKGVLPRMIDTGHPLDERPFYLVQRLTKTAALQTTTVALPCAPLGSCHGGASSFCGGIWMDEDVI